MSSIRYRVRQRVAIVLGNVRRRRIDAFWFIKEKNFGDLLTPLLLKHYGLVPVHKYPQEAEAFVCGSIMEKIPSDFTGFVLGTGFMHARSTKALPNAEVLAVRGHLSRERLGGDSSVLVGDPGLLIGRLYRRRARKQYRLGIIPHYADKKDAKIYHLYQRHKKEALLIDVQRSPWAVAKDIDKCEMVVSSSLHGIVFADALGVPNVWMIVSDRVSGKGFKFQDYNSALNKEQQFIRITGEETIEELQTHACLASAVVVKEIAMGLEDAFRRLRDSITKYLP